MYSHRSYLSKMAMMRIPSSIFCIALLALCTMAEDHSVEFGYYGSKGPDKWGSLSPEFSACSKGKSQSPVDLRKESLVYHKHLKHLHRNYHSTNATLVNNGFNIGVHFDGEVGDISINGQNYLVKQMHWHSPSEHRINGKQMDAELHIVHVNQEGSFAVVGVLFKLGRSDPIISKMEDKLIELAKESAGGYKGAHVELGRLEVRHLKRKSRTYYRYMGSLTTPPCKENVTWTILGKVRSLSLNQLKLLKAPLTPQFKKNARPDQPLNARKIHKYFD